MVVEPKDKMSSADEFIEYVEDRHKGTVLEGMSEIYEDNKEVVDFFVENQNLFSQCFYWKSSRVDF